MKKIYFSILFFAVTFSLFSNSKENGALFNTSKKEKHKELLQQNKLQKAVLKKGISLDQIGLAELLPNYRTKLKPSGALILLESEINTTVKPAKLSPHVVKSYQNRALAAKQYVFENNAFKALLNGVNFELPIGIKKEIGNAEYTVIIDSIKVTPDYAYVVAYMLIDDIKSGKQLYFLGRDIRFSRDGGFTGDARLELLQDYTLKIGDAAEVTFKVDPEQQKETFVMFDCEGFKRLHLDADILFDKLFVPENEDGEPQEGQIKAAFRTDITDWNNWIVEIPYLETFQIKGIKGVSFSLENIAFDKSDYTNPLNMKFPEGYWEGVENQFIDTWEGFYAGNITVKLPNTFDKRGSDERIVLNARNMLIDRKGFTGHINGQNIFTVDEGDLDGWQYSLDYFHLSFMHTNLEKGAFGGKLLLPISGESQQFSYNSIIVPDESFRFQVRTDENLSFPVFGASDVTLYANSNVEINVIDGKFKPKADLSGVMNIAASMNAEEGKNEDPDGNGSLNLASIQFNRLILQTEAPYLKLHEQGGGISFGSDAAKQNMGKFPITILNLGFQNLSNNRVALLISMRVNLSKKEDSGFAGEADGAIIGHLDSKSEFTRWKFQKARIDRILVDVKNGGFSLFGEISFFREDAVYGNGFGGRIKATFDPGFEIESSVIFGNKDELDDEGNTFRMRYWFVDGMLTLPPSSAIPIFTGVSINGFGGGAYYHMKMDPAGSGMQTASGISYVPDKNTFLGVRAAIKICGNPTPVICKGEVNFEITFREGGGLGKIAFYGMATLVSFDVSGADAITQELKKEADAMAAYGDGKATIIPNTPEGSAAMKAKLNAKADGAIGASWLIIWDNDNNSLHSDLEILVNVDYALIGSQKPNNVAGQMVMHFEPGYWYIHAGTPSAPNSVYALGLVRLEAYFMAGHKLEPFAPPPPGVEDVSNVNPSILKHGSGVAFGSRVHMDTGDKRFLIFYARFSAGFGFDVMVMNFNPPVHCVGRSKPLGVNNWFAIGRAYAFVFGSMGLQAKVFGKVRKLEIGYIGASLSLGAKMPNPSFFVGAVRVEYRVLGGLIKGKCNFRLSLGQECQIAGAGELGGIEIIATMTPSPNQTDISVFSKPYAVLNMGLGEEFEVLNDDGDINYYRASLTDVRVMDVKTKTRIPGTYFLNAKRDLITFKPVRTLPANTKLAFVVMVGIEKKYGNYDWRIVPDEVELKIAPFKTGEDPNEIPNDNILYAYPGVNMKNLYKEEYNKGFLKMSMLQSKPLTLEKDYRFEVRYYQEEELIYSDESLTISNMVDAKRHLEFSLPTYLFENEQDYTLKIVKTPIEQSTNSTVNDLYTDGKEGFEGGTKLLVEDKTKGVEEDKEDYSNTMSVRSRSVDGLDEELEEIVIVDYTFHTSQFDRWKDKFDTYATSHTLNYTTGDGHNINLELDEGNEYWEATEMFMTSNAGDKIDPLVRGVLTNFETIGYKKNTYGDYLKETVYKPKNIPLMNRDIDPALPLPSDKVFLKPSQDNYRVNVATARGVLRDYISLWASLSERLSMLLYGNASHLNGKAIPSVALFNYLDPMLFNKYDPMPNGKYYVEMGYYLPGEDRPNSLKKMSFDFTSHELFKSQHSKKIDYMLAAERNRLISLLLTRNIVVVPIPRSVVQNKAALLQRIRKEKQKQVYHRTPSWRKKEL